MINTYSVLFIFTILNLLYWIAIFSRLSIYNPKFKSFEQNNNKISQSVVIIPIKNKEKNLIDNISSLTNQVPKGFDFIVVDDYSISQSLNTLNEIPNLEGIIVIKNKFDPGKKYALSYAISKTNKEYIVLTDADCFVRSKFWLRKMINSFNHNTSIVLGYGPYTGSGWLNIFVRFETFMAAIQYFSYYLIGIPYMGVGRNMAIRKSFFKNKRGYENHLDIKSGNDDLFVNENSTIENTEIQIDPDTFVYSTPPETLTGFIKQKTRHISTSFRYKTIHKLLLGLYSLSHILFYFSLIASFFFIPFYQTIAIWIFRMIIIYISSYFSFIKLKETDLLKYLPVLDFLMFIYYTFMGIYYFFAPKNKW